MAIINYSINQLIKYRVINTEFVITVTNSASKRGNAGVKWDVLASRAQGSTHEQGER